MGLSDDLVDSVFMTALVHDIGKLSVPAEILNKPGKLSVQEHGLIREHPRSGHDILLGIEFPWPVAEVAMKHHERMDGSGYPQGLTGDDIIIEARIVAVADIIEAMASHRPYRAALGMDAAVAEITRQPEAFDEQVVAACVRLFEGGRIKL
jgi:HD-GYP domain-containing protein (c-di-GMP phosphodiesterase class II)